MRTALKIEMIKAKASGYLKAAMIVPLIFLVFTLMTLLSSQNPTGVTSGLSIMQVNIYNLWCFILLPIGIVMIINGDYQQENKALGLQQALANNWSLKARYWAKSFKYWLLLLLSHLALILVTVISNALTTKIATNFWLLLCVSLVIWIGSWPLIVINMHLLRYMNAIIVSLINLAFLAGSTLLEIPQSHWFWVDPWTYALRTIALLRINPNSTVIPPNSPLATDTKFIYLILLSVMVWLVINYFLAMIVNKKER